MIYNNIELNEYFINDVKKKINETKYIDYIDSKFIKEYQKKQLLRIISLGFDETCSLDNNIYSFHQSKKSLFIFPTTIPKYHSTYNCTGLNNDFINFIIPNSIAQRGKDEIQKYRIFFQAKQRLFEEKYWDQIKLLSIQHFKTEELPELYEKNNSGVTYFSIEELIKKIDLLIKELEEKFEEKSNAPINEFLEEDSNNLKLKELYKTLKELFEQEFLFNKKFDLELLSAFKLEPCLICCPNNFPFNKINRLGLNFSFKNYSIRIIDEVELKDKFLFILDSLDSRFTDYYIKDLIIENNTAKYLVLLKTIEGTIEEEIYLINFHFDQNERNRIQGFIFSISERFLELSKEDEILKKILIKLLQQHFYTWSDLNKLSYYFRRDEQINKIMINYKIDITKIPKLLIYFKLFFSKKAAKSLFN